MATKSPRQHHSQWPNVSASSQLPNTSIAAIQDSALEVGDTCYSIAEAVLYVCTDATLGSAVWVDPAAGGAGGGGAPLTSVSLGGWYTYTQGSPPVEEVLGNDSFDGALVGTLPLVFKASVTNSWTFTGTTRVRLYDVGPAAGPPTAPRQVCELTFTANGPGSAEQALTVVSATPGANQVLNTDRMYEATVIQDASTVGDVAFVGSAVLEIPSPATVLETVKSELWAPPETPNALDDEFDSDVLDPAWILTNCNVPGTPVAGTLSLNTVDVYDVAFTTAGVLRVNPNPVTRRSWALAQSAAGIANTISVLSKPITLPTNMLIVARARLSERVTISPVNNDCGIALALFADNGGLPDRAINGVECFLNEQDAGTVQADFSSWIGGVPTSTPSANVTDQGQALQYVAIHKIGSVYHGWVGTAVGNWIYMGEVTGLPTLSHVGFVIMNETTNLPGVNVVGIDFIRFYETANFLF